MTMYRLLMRQDDLEWMRKMCSKKVLFIASECETYEGAVNVELESFVIRDRVETTPGILGIVHQLLRDILCKGEQNEVYHMIH